MIKLTDCTFDGIKIEKFEGSGLDLCAELAKENKQMYLEKLINGNCKIGYSTKESGRFMELTIKQLMELQILLVKELKL